MEVDGELVHGDVAHEQQAVSSTGKTISAWSIAAARPRNRAGPRFAAPALGETDGAGIVYLNRRARRFRHYRLV
jgi:hypothetical protein